MSTVSDPSCSQCRALRSENRRTGSERRFCGRDDSPRQPVSSRESTGAATAVPVTLELGHAPQTAMAGESGVRHSAARTRIFKLYRPARRRLAAVARGGSYRFGGGNGSRIGSGLIFARIALSVRTRGDNGNRSPSMMLSSSLSSAAFSSSVRSKFMTCR